MKWVALIIVLAAAGFLCWGLRRNPNSVTKALMLMGFLPFALDLDSPLHLYGRHFLARLAGVREGRGILRFGRYRVISLFQLTERAISASAASMMISDHPLGVGANQYVVVANVDGYNRAAGVMAVPGSLGANVHNVYLLVTAETGYLGLITFVLLLLRPMLVAFLSSWRHPGDQRSDLLLGLGVALLTVYLHNFFEWIFVTFQAQYMFALDLGLVAGLTQQLGYQRRSGHMRQLFSLATGAGLLPITPKKPTEVKNGLWRIGPGGRRHAGGYSAEGRSSRSH